MAQSLADLLQGYKKFQAGYFKEEHGIFGQLAQGQEPKVLVVACSDSRVDPALILQAQLGDLFVIRNVANLVPPFEQDSHFHGVSAALEFGVCHLNIEHIIVLGHSHCAGIKALINNELVGEESFVKRWMDIAYDAQCSYEHTLSDLHKEQEVGRQAIKNSINNLLSFPWIAKRVEQNKLSLHGWVFDIPTGVLFEHEEETDKFIAL